MQDELGRGPVGPAGPSPEPYQEGDTGPRQLPQVLLSSFSVDRLCFPGKVVTAWIKKVAIAWGDIFFLVEKQCCGSGSEIRDPGSGAFLTPGSGIRDPELVFSGSRIPNPYF